MNAFLPPTTEAQAVVRMEGRIRQLAARYASALCPLEDLCQEGRLGAMEAYRRFDPGRGLQFSTYADFYILKQIRRCHADTRSLIRVPQYRQRQAQARTAGDPLPLVHSFSAWEDNPDAALFRDTHTQRCAEYLLIQAQCASLLGCLPPLLRQALVLRFWEEWTQREIGAHLGVTRSQANRIERTALARLRLYLAETTAEAQGR